MNRPAEVSRETFPAISVHQPWAFSIAHLGKPVENRGWATSYRGPIAVHATLKWDQAGEDSPLVQAGWINYIHTLPRDNVPRVPLDAGSLWIEHGAVLAVAEVVGCHLDPDSGDPCSPWAADGQWHWDLADVRPLREPVPCKGRQRLWRLPADVDAAVRAQLVKEGAA